MAIEHGVGLDHDAAFEDANHIMDIFGFEGRVLDNLLDSEDRQLLMILEEEGLLGTERDEAQLYDGRNWRLHYWTLKKDTIHQMADSRRELGMQQPVQVEEDPYAALDDDVWRRG